MNPLIRLIATQPNLLAAHAESYAHMVTEELSLTTASLQRRALLGVGALVFFVISVILGGIALMLWAASPQPPAETSWVLFAVPAVPLILALLFFVMLRSDPKRPLMSKVKTQFKADVAMLHETGVL